MRVIWEGVCAGESVSSAGGWLTWGWEFFVVAQPVAKEAGMDAA